MQIVLITPTEYCNSISFNAQNNAQSKNISFEKSQKGKNDKVTVINNKETFEGTSFDSIFNTGDYGERQVFIVPELAWFDDSDDVEQGYKCALQLLRRYDKPFVLHFISIFAQPLLLKMVGEDYKSLVEAFPHYHLLSELPPMKPRAYSLAHFNLIKKIFISYDGYLSFLLHNVQNEPTKDFDSFKKRAISILERLSISPFAEYQTDIKNLENKVENIKKGEDDDTNVSNLNSIWDQVKNLIIKIQGNLKGGNPSSILNENYRILIVEDEKDQRKRLYDFFSKRFKHVGCNDIEATLSKDELEIWNEKNKDEEKERCIKKFKLDDCPEKWFDEHAEQNDIVFLDLLYVRSNGTILPYSGIDFFHRILSANSYCVIKVITSLPRNEISIIDKEISPHVLTKSGGWDMLEGYLTDRLEEILKECDKNKELQVQNQNSTGPTIGFFGAELVRRLIIQWRNEPYHNADAGEFDDANKETVLGHHFKMANDYIAAVMGRNKKLETYGKSAFTQTNITKEYVQKYLFKILANRILTLKYITINGWGNAIDPNQFRTTNNMSAIPDEKYFGRIGFSVTKTDNGFLTLTLDKNKDLFIEEKTYYDNLQFKNVDSVVWIHAFAGFCSSVVQKLPEAEKDILKTPIDGMTPNQIMKLLQFILKDKELCQQFSGNNDLCNYFYIRFLINEECENLIYKIIQKSRQNDRKILD